MRSLIWLSTSVMAAAFGSRIANATSGFGGLMLKWASAALRIS